MLMETGLSGLTFLASAKLTTFAADFSVKAIGKGANEIKNVGISASSLNLFLCNLVLWLGSTQEDVESDSASIQRLQKMSDQSNFT
jgi:hypothetical protein